MKVVFSKSNEKLAVSLKISDDKLKLFLDASPVQKVNFNKEDLIALITEFAPNAELNEGVIDDVLKALNRGEAVEERRIAKGREPEEGADGKILFLIKKFSLKPEISEEKKSYQDLTELHLFDNVKAGQIIGRLYPPKPGTDGVDALGGKIPAKAGKPVKPSLDKSLLLKEEAGQPYQVIEAQAEGYLSEDNGKFGIKSELQISGDLDLKYGSLDFVGKVIVGGDVLQGLNIKAKKGIEIRGSLRGGSLISADGDIVVKGFVYGGKDSRIISGRSFSANVAQEVSAEIAGDIVIRKEALDCKLRSESSVYVTDGQLVGGECFVVCGVEAKFLGNQANKETRIFFCSDVESRTEYTRLLAQIESHVKAKKLLELHLGPLASNPARLQLLKSPHREKMQSLLTKLNEVERGRITLTAQKQAMLEKARSNPVIRANYLATCYAGVSVFAGEDQHHVKQDIKGPGSITYSAETKAFEEGKYQELSCEYNKPADEAEKKGDSNGPKKEP